MAWVGWSSRLPPLMIGRASASAAVSTTSGSLLRSTTRSTCRLASIPMILSMCLGVLTGKNCDASSVW